MTDAASTPEQGPAADYSLRPNGKTYLERNREATKILNRIENSLASVIGISGVRGAGKSSLANKVLEDCKEKKYFTLLIPSPTGYEPREFLLAIFQGVAEDVSEKTRQLFEGTRTLAALGEEDARAVRRLSYFVLGLFGLLGVLTMVGTYYVGYQQARKAELALIARLNAQAQFVDVELEKNKIRRSVTAADLNDETRRVAREQALGSEAMRRGITSERDKKLFEEKTQSGGPDAEIIEKLVGPMAEKLANEAIRAVRNLLSEEDNDVFQAKFRNLTDLQLLYLVQDIQREPIRSRVRPTRVLEFETLSVAALIAIFILAGMFALRIFFRMTRKYALFRKYDKQAGLARTSREFLDLVKYQKVLSSGSELSLPLKYLTGKLTRSQQLTDRPLSLPGLTAECSKYLKQVAEVFNGKVVICIDELDKITDVAALLELLKGIKGILGQENTHFLLTISEDAMAFFTERLSRERNLVESSFEEIVYLDRLDYDLSIRVVRRALSLPETASIPAPENIMILWLFGAGIPREIKRNMITCDNEGAPVAQAAPRQLWRILYRAKLNGMLTLSAPKANEAQEHYRFLICVEQILHQVDEASWDDGCEFGKLVLNIIRDNFQPNFKSLAKMGEARWSARKVARTTQRDDSAGLADPDLYLGQLMEAIIGAIAIAVINPGNGAKRPETVNLDSLIYVYKFIPINPQYAFYVLDKFLDTKLAYLDFSLDILSKAKPRVARGIAEAAAE